MRYARTVLCAVALAAVPALAAAAVVVTPSSVTIDPGDATPFVTVQLTFPVQSLPGTANLEITPPPALVGFAALDPDPVSFSWTSGATSATTQFRLLTSSDIPPATYVLTVSDEVLGAGSAPFRLTVREPPEPEFDGVVAPSVVNLALGGASGSVRVRTLPESGFDSTVTWRLEGLPGFIGTSGPRTSGAPGYPDVEFPLALGPGATVGTFTGTVRGTAPAVPAVTRALTVVVTTSSFEATLEPDRLSLVAGGASGSLSVRTSAPGVVNGAVTYTVVGLPPGMTASGQRTSAAPGFPPVSFTLQASPEAAAGTFTPRVRGVLVPGSVVTEVPFAANVERPAPRILAVAPGRFVRGTLAQRLRILGSDFEPGARVVSRSAAVRVRKADVLDGETIELEIDIRSDAPPGAALFDVQNPDGQTSPSPGRVIVLAEGSLAAPLTVHSVAVLHPSPGAVVSPGDAPRPRGVVVVSGSGPLVASWRLDGVTFDRLVVQARGGEPVPVEARAPVPETSLGQHLLQLVVEGEREIASEPVALVQTPAQAQGHRILSPPDGRVVLGGEPPLLSWTQVAGSSGYVVEVTRVDGGPAVAEWPARSARLRPASADLDRLGPGVFEWRVRARFAGGALGDPTPPRRLVLLPPSVRLEARVSRAADGALEIAWTGGAVGLLYQVECVGADGEVAFAALTAETSYRLPLRVAEPEGDWRIRALAPDGSVLGSSEAVSPQAALDRGPLVGRIRFAAASVVDLVARSPDDGAALADALPLIGASWEGALDPDEVVLVVDATDVTAVADLEPDSIAFEPFLPLTDGSHEVRLTLGERTFEWGFTVRSGGESAAEDADVDYGTWDGGAASGPDGGGWQVDFDLTGSRREGEAPVVAASQALATLTVSGERRSSGGFLQTDVDFSARQAIEPDDAFEEENRSWVVEAGRESGALRPSVALGYTAPDFLADAEILSVGYPKGGGQVAVASGPVRIAWYEAFDPDLEGATSTISGPEQELGAAALELGGESFDLRLVGVEVEERDGLFFAGGEGSLYGLHGTWRVGGTSSFTLELARGEFTPSAASLESAGEGDAARLAFSTSSGAWSFDLALRDVDPEFVNPANRGLAVGGIPDRRGADLRLSRAWSAGSFDVSARRFDSGGGDAAVDVDASLSAVDLSLFQRLGERADLGLSLGYGVTESDAAEDLGLAATERTDRSVAINLSERLGRFTWTQNVSWTDSDDGFDPTTFSDSVQAGLSVQREGPRFGLQGLANAVRSRFGEGRATSESLLVSLQPTWRWPRAGIALVPYGSYSRFEDDFSSEATVTENYRLTLSWRAPRLVWLSAVQLASDWARTEGPFTLDADFVVRYTASLSVGWGSGRSAAAGFASAPPSGFVPLSAGDGLGL